MSGSKSYFLRDDVVHTNSYFHGVFQPKSKSGMCCPPNHILVVCYRQKSPRFYYTTIYIHTVSRYTENIVHLNLSKYPIYNLERSE